MSTPPVSKPGKADIADAAATPDAQLGARQAQDASIEHACAPQGAPASVLGALDALAPEAKPIVHDAALLAAMAQARHQADLAAALGEVPVGAVVLFEGRTIASAHNRREVDKDPLAHAEILALRAAARVLDRWRLTGCTLVVSLEPCFMCAGAIVNSRIDHVVFGAWDAKAGAVGSLCNVVGDTRLNHRAQVTAGVEAEAARAQLQQFFAARRQDNKRSGL